MLSKNKPREMMKAAHSVSECWYHIIFATYKRQKILRVSWQVEDDVRKGILDSLHRMGCVVEDVAIQDDHVHILCQIPPKFSLAQALQRIKGFTSRKVRQSCEGLGGKKLWSKSYYTATATVGGDRFNRIKNYIEKQDRVSI